jgi:hypothetical protein
MLRFPLVWMVCVASSFAAFPSMWASRRLRRLKFVTRVAGGKRVDFERMFSLFVSPPMTLLYARYPAASLPLMILARLIYSGLSGVLDGVRTKVVIQFHDQFLKRLVNTRVVMMSATLNDPSVACRCTAVIDDWSGPEAEEYAVKHLRMLMPGEPVNTVFNFDSAGKRLFQREFDAGVYYFLCPDTKLLFTLDHERVEHARLQKLTFQPFLNE